MKRNGLLLAVLLLPVFAAAQNAEDQVGKEIGRLRQVAASLPENDDVKGMRPVLTGALDRAEQSLKAGRLFHALDLLTQVAPRLSALQFREQPRFANADIRKFEDDWGAMDKEFAAGEARFKQMSWSRTPAAVRAMSEAAWSQVRVIYDAALPYAQNTSPRTGYYYLGEARGSLDWALFLRALRFAKVEPAPQFRSIAGEIAQLEARIGEAYRPPLSMDKHPQFIRLNATVKQAIELNDAEMYAGALYMYLRAQRFLGQILAVAPEAAELASLKQQLAAGQKNAEHHAIARIFTEGAESSLASTDPEELKMARAAIEQVVPAYFAVLQKPAIATAPGGKRVTVTLVRWPYT